MLRFYTLLFLLIAPLLAQDRPKPVADPHLRHWKHYCGTGIIEDISRSKAVKLTPENTPKPWAHLIPEGHDVYNLIPYIQTSLTKHTFKESEYILYDISSGHILVKSTPQVIQLVKQLVAKQLSKAPASISVQGTLISVKRPDDPFLEWDKEQVQAHDPKVLATFSALTRSGEKHISTYGDPDNPSNEFEVEPVISEDHRIIDLRLALFINAQKEQEGFQFNTGLTLRNGQTFVHPYGFSITPGRVTLLSIKASSVSPEGAKMPDLPDPHPNH